MKMTVNQLLTQLSRLIAKRGETLTNVESIEIEKQTDMFEAPRLTFKITEEDDS